MTFNDPYFSSRFFPSYYYFLYFRLHFYFIYYSFRSLTVFILNLPFVLFSCLTLLFSAMPPGGPDRTVITSTTFNNPNELSADDFAALSVNSTADFPTVLLNNINWNGGIIGCLSISLSPDNLRVDSASFHLLGSLWTNKAFSTANYWISTSPSQLILSIEDLSIFKFPPGSLCSSYVSSADLDFQFTQDNSDVPTALISQAGLSEFCLRAFCYPTSDSFAKLIVLLFPCSETQLAQNPLYQDPYFPGLRLFDSEFPLSPPSSQSPISVPWGFPLAPAVFPGADWDDAPGFPSSVRVRVSLSKLLRSAIKPDVKANLLTFQQRVDALLERGSNALQVRFPLLLWPEASVVPPTDLPSQGWVLFIFYLFLP